MLAYSFIDIAGSVRIPAHYMGICSLKPSNGRIPKTGNTSSNAGIESIPGVVGTMARTVDDLEFFTRTIVQFECWKYDQGVVPLPWREVKLSEKLRIGYFTYDGVYCCFILFSLNYCILVDCQLLCTFDY